MRRIVWGRGPHWDEEKLYSIPYGAVSNFLPSAKSLQPARASAPCLGRVDKVSSCLQGTESSKPLQVWGILISQE